MQYLIDDLAHMPLAEKLELIETFLSTVTGSTDGAQHLESLMYHRQELQAHRRNLHRA